MKKLPISLIAVCLFSVMTCINAQQDELPEIRIETQDGAEIISKDDWVNMISFVLTDPNDASHNISKIGAHSVDQYHRIRGRGNTTWGYPKKPFRLRFREKVSVFGKEPAENWVLLAEYLDPTYLVNPTAFHVGDILDVRFNHSFQHIHLYLNGNYQGLYLVTEHNQVGKGRVDIDPEKGWLVEMDTYYDSDPKFISKGYDLPVMIKSPDHDGLASDPVYQFVVDDINQLCEAMASSRFPENGYRDLIDMDAVVDYLMATEIVYSNELFHPKSAYVHKDRDQTIALGPLWDFDWAFTNLGTHTYFKRYDGYVMKADFYKRFYQDPIFAMKFKERWNQKHSEISAVYEFIDDLGSKLGKHFLKDLDRWKDNYGSDYPSDYHNEVERMKAWWLKRVAWLHSSINHVEALPSQPTWYLENQPKTITVVSYGEISQLSAYLKLGSHFEIGMTDKESSEGGGVLNKLEIKLKSILEIEHRDTLLLSGFNQDTSFTIQIPLHYVPTSDLQEECLLDFKLYPNPWSQHVYLHGAEHCVLNVFNMSSVLVHQQRLTNSNEMIDLARLIPGIYFFCIEKDGVVKSIKTVKI